MTNPLSLIGQFLANPAALIQQETQQVSDAATQAVYAILAEGALTIILLFLIYREVRK